MIYDLIIIGSGPAGYSSAIYTSRYSLKTLLIGYEQGGMAASAHQVDNYPGFDSINGKDLMEKFNNHATKLGTKIVRDKIIKIDKTNGGFNLFGELDKYQAKTIILALGTKKRKINVPGEKEFLGRGVSYCATCDAAFFKNKNVAIIGGGNSAFQAAMQLNAISNKIYIIFNEKISSTMPHWLEEARKSPKITMISTNTITKINGENIVHSINLRDKFNGKDKLLVDGIFIEIGTTPNSELINSLGVITNDKDFIIVDKDQATNIKGVFACGDVTTNSANFQQIITAAAEGSIAALSAFKYIKKNK